MLSRLLTEEPYELTRPEQVASALLAAAVATLAAGAVASALFYTVVKVLL